MEVFLKFILSGAIRKVSSCDFYDLLLKCKIFLNPDIKIIKVSGLTLGVLKGRIRRATRNKYDEFYHWPRWHPRASDQTT